MTHYMVVGRLDNIAANDFYLAINSDEVTYWAASQEHARIFDDKDVAEMWAKANDNVRDKTIVWRLEEVDLKMTGTAKMLIEALDCLNHNRWNEALTLRETFKEQARGTQFIAMLPVFEKIADDTMTRWEESMGEDL